MAAFNTLTPEQQASWYAWENMLRASSGELSRFINHARAISALYTNQIQAILVALTDNSVVPNTSGLAGAASLDSDAEAAVIMADLNAILTTYDTAAKRQLYSKACGAPNMIG